MSDKKQTVEEVAKLVSELGEYDRSLESIRENYFIKGAKSDAARDYWFKIFKETFGDTK